MLLHTAKFLSNQLRAVGYYLVLLVIKNWVTKSKTRRGRGGGGGEMIPCFRPLDRPSDKDYYKGRTLRHTLRQTDRPSDKVYYKGRTLKHTLRQTDRPSDRVNYRGGYASKNIYCNI